MTQSKQLLFAILLMGTMVFSGCSLSQMAKMAKDQQLTVTPNPLEVHADSVKYDMSAVLPVKMLKKGKVYTAKNIYVYGDQELETGSIDFKADDYPNAKEQEPRDSRTFSFAYNPAMEKGELMVQGIASDPRNGKFKESPRLTVAPGVITTSRKYMEASYAVYAPHGYNNQEELIPTYVEYYFLQGSSVLRSSEIRSDKGKQFDAFIAAKNVTRTVTITGTHSPEGSETINTDLAGNRAESIEKYYRRQMDRYDYEGMADSINFILKPVVRDWTGFKAMLADYDGISQEEKNAMLNVVNGSGVFEDKEKELKKLSGYRAVFRDIYPKLRTAKTEVLTVKEKKTDAEIAVLAKGVAGGTVSPDTLSDEELGYAATLTPDLKEKEAIYKAATKKNDSWASHNNLGAVYLEMAANAGNDQQKNDYLNMAQTQFELSNRKENNAPASANMAIVYAMQGNTQAAYDAFGNAMRMSMPAEDAAGVKGVAGLQQIKLAKYSDAVSSLSGAEANEANMYNLALAQILNKEYENALSTLKEFQGQYPENAMGYYLAAIAFARTGQREQAAGEINVARMKDPRLFDIAVADLEFAEGAEYYRKYVQEKYGDGEE